HAIREGVMRARRDELHMNLHSPIRALHLDVRGARVLAVFGVVIGPLQIVERGGDTERRVHWRLLEREGATGDNTARLDVADRAGEVRVELDRERQEGGARRGARNDERCLDRLSVFLEHHASGLPVLREDRRTRAAPNLHTRDLGECLRDVRTRRPEDSGGTADMMVQEVERRAAGARPLFEVPDAERAEQSLQDITLEPVVEQLGDRHRQDPRQIDDSLLPAAANVQAEPGDARQLTDIARLGLYVRRRGKQTVIDLARILPMSIAELLDDWFESDVLKGLLGALGIWHLKQGPRSGGTAFNFLHHHVGCAAGVFRPARSNVTQTLSQVSGVEIRRGARATVLAKNGKATGVVLEKNGETIQAPLVVSSAAPRATLLPLAIELYPDFARAVSNIKARGVVARGTLTLEQSPPYSTFCIAPSLDYLERAYDDAKYGKDSSAPYVEVQRTDGRVEVHVQFVPPGTHHALADRVAQLLKVRSNQVALQPVEESLYHGELTLDQILFMRPVPGWSRYRTPIDGLYLCGSGTHPGGGIPGAAGRNAAREILKDTRRS